MDSKSETQNNEGGIDWSKFDIVKCYDVLGKLLSEELDCIVKFTVTKKEEK